MKGNTIKKETLVGLPMELLTRKQEVYSYLHSNPEGASVSKIAKKFNRPQTHISRDLRALKEEGYVELKLIRINNIAKYHIYSLKK